MTKASDNPFPYMQYVEQGSTPSNPASGSQRLFVRSSDHVLCMVNSSGTVTPLSGALTNPMSAANDMILGGTGGAPSRLAAVASKFLQTDGSGNVSWGAAPAGGITHTTQGTTSIGGSWDGTGPKVFKQITLSSAGLIASIYAAVKGDGSHGAGLFAALFTDNSGAPGVIIAANSFGGSSTSGGIGLNSTGKFVGLPIGAWLASGTFWLCVGGGYAAATGISIAYAATGGDYTTSSNPLIPADVGLWETPTNSSRNYSIYADVLR